MKPCAMICLAWEGTALRAKAGDGQGQSKPWQRHEEEVIR